MNQIEKRNTAPNKSYWAKTGAYQKEYNQLYKKLVPDTGEANTIHGEMLRAVSRLTYDYCNNGNCNVANMKTTIETDTCTCWNCAGTGEIDDYDEDLEDEKTISCEECGGSGVIESEEEINDHIEIDPNWLLMFDFLNHVMINNEPIKQVEAFVLDMNIDYYKFDDKEMSIYNKLIDGAIYQILTTENQSRIVKEEK